MQEHINMFRNSTYPICENGALRDEISVVFTFHNDQQGFERDQRMINTWFANSTERMLFKDFGLYDAIEVLLKKKKNEKMKTKKKLKTRSA
jgi:hypothetical protein